MLENSTTHAVDLTRYNDSATAAHASRMSQYAKALALEYGVSVDQAELICEAAPLHDIGKVGIPKYILLKPGKLTAAEYEVMQKHTLIAAEILKDSQSPMLQLARTIALYHHEKWNGKGYPRGLAGKEIPLAARIVALADVFDALTSIRPYKQAWTVGETVALIRDNSGEHFDPELCAIFEQILPSLLKIKSRFEAKNDARPLLI